MRDLSSLDIHRNRAVKKYGVHEIFLRVAWMIAHPLFRFSPRTFFWWRRALLRLFGAKIGSEVHVYNTATIYMPWNLEIHEWSSVGEHVYIYNLGKITIGQKVTISHRAHLCAGTHDYTKSDMPLQKLPITILDQAWVCSDAFIGPGVTIGEGAVLGARAVIVKDVPAWQVMAGNPARPIKTRVISGYE
ncbi:MAG: putative colanic acid biosynthesis acetyltransferase [Desulfobulbaceae bacterium]|nr:MAG: putative colanic acid biosynthesis acetyltransferase [Desulfobulbaceae bacterium]